MLKFLEEANMNEISVRQAIDNYLLACRAEGHSVKTMSLKRGFLNDFAKFTGDIAVRQIAPNTIQEYIVEKMDSPGKISEKMSSYSVAKYYSVVRAFLRWAYQQGMTDNCATDYTRPPRIDNDLPDALSPDELVRLVRHLKGAASFRDRVIFEFFLDTGCRLSEVIGLDVDDINLEGGYARVVGKGRKEALVPLGIKLSRDLHTYIVRHREATLGERAVFVTRHGTRFSDEGMKTLVRRHMNAVGVEGKHGPHKLRHTFATQFLRKGGDMETLRRILRHTDIKVTQRYTHLRTEDLLQAHRLVSPMGDIF
jgi:site-specific recombinase XerD